MRSNMRIFFMLILTCIFLKAEEVQVEESSSSVEEVIVEKVDKSVSQFEGVKVEEVNDKPSAIDSNPLLELIEKVKEAKGEERRTLMNALKLELRAMNKEKRQETMKQIKHSLGKNDTKEEHKTQSRHKSQMREHQHQRHQPQFRPMHGRMGAGHGGNH